jgi:DNA polymerase IV
MCLCQLTKAVVKPQWLFDSVAHGSSVPCKAYAALAELQASTEENCPSCGCEGHQTSDEEDGSDSDAEVYMVLGKRRREKHCMECDCWCKGTGHEARLTKRQGGIFPSPPSSPSNSPLSRRMFPPTPTSTPKKHPHESVLESLPSAQSKALTYLRPPSLPITTDLSKLRPDSSTACQRACPLTCVNQGLVEALDIIRQNRYLEGEARSELSYMRAIGVIKGEWVTCQCTCSD